MMTAGRRAFSFLLPSIILCCSGPLVGHTRKLSGRIFAYDPSVHLVKMASFVPNSEIVVFRLNGRKGPPQFVKLVFSSFGSELVSEGDLQGGKEIAVRGKRSK